MNDYVGCLHCPRAAGQGAAAPQEGTPFLHFHKDTVHPQCHVPGGFFCQRRRFFLIHSKALHMGLQEPGTVLSLSYVLCSIQASFGAS